METINKFAFVENDIVDIIDKYKSNYRIEIDFYTKYDHEKFGDFLFKQYTKYLIIYDNNHTNIKEGPSYEIMILYPEIIGPIRQYKYKDYIVNLSKIYHNNIEESIVSLIYPHKLNYIELKGDNISLQTDSMMIYNNMYYYAFHIYHKPDINEDTYLIVLENYKNEFDMFELYHMYKYTEPDIFNNIKNNVLSMQLPTKEQLDSITLDNISDNQISTDVPRIQQNNDTSLVKKIKKFKKKK